MSTPKDILGQVLAALSNGLDALYPDIPVIPEWVPNDLPRRCFLIGFAGDVEITHELGDRYKVSGKLDIAYYSPKKDAAAQREMNEVFTAISLGLQYVRFEDIRLKLATHEKQVVDGVLHDICTFTTFLYRIDTTPPMGDIAINQKEVHDG